MQKLKTNLLNTKSSKVPPLKPGVIQNIAMHAFSTARNVFLKLPSTLPALSSLFFPKPLSSFFLLPVLTVVNAAPCVGPQNKICHPACCHRRLLQIPVLSVHETSKTCVIMHYNSQSSKEEYKPWKWGATARYYTSHTKTLLPTR